MRIAGISHESLVDGPGVRVVVFAQGCDIGCKNCHNPSSWDTTAGKEYIPRVLARTITKRRPGIENIQGVTFSGGEPFMQAEEFSQLAEIIKSRGAWDIVTYTGHTYEKLLARTNDTGVQKLLALTDYLIDGAYVHELRDLDLRFRGSKNQRFIDLNATRESGTVVLL